jgi:hypothetical protein
MLVSIKNKKLGLLFIRKIYKNNKINKMVDFGNPYFTITNLKAI